LTVTFEAFETVQVAEPAAAVGTAIAVVCVGVAVGAGVGLAVVAAPPHAIATSDTRAISGDAIFKWSSREW